MTKRQLIELLEKYPEETQVQLALAHDAEAGDLLEATRVDDRATIEGVVVLIEDPYHRD
jgi:hypothetical protein